MNVGARSLPVVRARRRALAWLLVALPIGACTSVAPSPPAVEATPGAVRPEPAILPAMPQPTIEPWVFGGAQGSIVRLPGLSIHVVVRDRWLADTLPRFAWQSMQHYRTALGALPEPRRPIDTYIFGKRSQWEQYTREALRDSAELYLGMGRGGYTIEGRAVLYDIGPVDTLFIVAHEGWHQYTQSTFVEQLPPWMEEGLATFMEGHRMRNERTTIEFLPWRNLERFSELRSVVREGRMVSLGQLVSGTPQSFLGDGRDSLLSYYAQVWALMHFLNEGEGGRYRAAFRQLIDDAANGRMADRMGLVRRSRLMPGRLVLSQYFKVDERELDRQYQAFVKQVVASGAGDAIWLGENPIDFAARKAAAASAKAARAPAATP